MSHYVDFYRGKRTTPIGHFSIKEIMQFEDSVLEREHGYIQWVFPNPTLSRVQPGAASQPLTKDAVLEMLNNEKIMKRVEKMLDRMLGFWGIARSDVALVRISDKKRFNAKLGCTNHNQLRMTRLLTFLKCFDYGCLLDSLKELLFANVSPKQQAMKFWMSV